MNLRQQQAHMAAAEVYSRLSYCNRRKVGCVVVEQDRIVSIGYNGTPRGEDNCCEDADNNTKANVIHAEDNALRKLVENQITTSNASLFVTTAPCMQCAKKILQFGGITSVFYRDAYRSEAGLDVLRQSGVTTVQQI